MNTRIFELALVAVLGGITGCLGSVPPRTYAVCMSAKPCFDPGKDPYWENPAFERSLLDAVQSAVHDPVDAADMSTPGLHATVKFTYLQGIIEYPQIVMSTNIPELDKLMLHQVAAVKAPPAMGLRSDEPHEFIIDLDMPTAFESFQSSIYAAIEDHKVYPKEPIIRGITGNTTVDFDYLDGKANDIKMTQSSNIKSLDQASLDAVVQADFPQSPPVYAGKSLHMNVVFCYTMISRAYGETAKLNTCPVSRNVIVIQGERFRRDDIQVVPTERER